MDKKNGNVKVSGYTAKLNEILRAKNSKPNTTKGPRPGSNSSPKANVQKNFIRRSGPRGG